MRQLELFVTDIKRLCHLAVISSRAWQKVLGALYLRGLSSSEGLCEGSMQYAAQKRSLNMQRIQQAKISTHYIKSLKVSLSFRHYNVHGCKMNFGGLGQ